MTFFIGVRAVFSFCIHVHDKDNTRLLFRLQDKDCKPILLLRTKKTSTKNKYMLKQGSYYIVLFIRILPLCLSPLTRKLHTFWWTRWCWRWHIILIMFYQNRHDDSLIFICNYSAFCHVTCFFKKMLMLLPTQITD